ncbi:MAG TPA: arginase family protein [Dongiaceae bacterium]
MALSPHFRTEAPAKSFLGWPVVTDPAGWSADIAVMGVPQSEPYSGEPCPNDQASAPDIVRGQSGQFSDGPAHWDFDLGAPLQDILPPRCLDIGNVAWRSGSYDQHFANVIATARHFWRRDALLLSLGGDHGVTIPLLQALEVLQRPIHIVHVDAHLDWRDEVRGVKRGYSSPLRRASECPWVSGITHIGLRGTGSARRPEVEAALAYGAKIFTADDVHGIGMKAVIDQLPRDTAFFITIDADGLDPACMPGVLAPAPGGLQPEMLRCLLRGIAGRGKVVGMDVVEVAPSFDFANQLTAIMAGRLLINLIGAVYGKRR